MYEGSATLRCFALAKSSRTTALTLRSPRRSSYRSSTPQWQSACTVSTEPAFDSRCQLHLYEGPATLHCGALANCSRSFGARVGSPKVAAVADIQRHLPCKQAHAGGNPASSSKFVMAGLAEWLRHWIVAPVTRVRFSHLAPIDLRAPQPKTGCYALANCSRLVGARVGSPVGVRIRGLHTACTRAMRVRVSHRPPDFGS